MTYILAAFQAYMPWSWLGLIAVCLVAIPFMLRK